MGFRVKGLGLQAQGPEPCLKVQLGLGPRD